MNHPSENASPKNSSTTFEAFSLIDKTSTITGRALRVFEKHKEKIMRHGYHRRQDRYYRCDETVLLPSLRALGFTKRHGLVRDLCTSLLAKQQPEGYWLFRGQPSPWYTIEAVAALASTEEKERR